MKRKKPPKKWWYTSLALPDEYRERLEAKVTAGETPTVAWWIRRVVQLALEAEAK